MGDDGLEGRFLSVDIDCLVPCIVEVDDVLLITGEGLRFERSVEDVVGDLYLELTSLGLVRRVDPFLFSAGTRGRLVELEVECFRSFCSNSFASIKPVQISPH